MALPSKYPPFLPNQLYLNRQYTKNYCLLSGAACGATALAPDPVTNLVPAASAHTAAAHTAATSLFSLITERLENKWALVKMWQYAGGKSMVYKHSRQVEIDYDLVSCDLLYIIFDKSDNIRLQMQYMSD